MKKLLLLPIFVLILFSCSKDQPKFDANVSTPVEIDTVQKVEGKAPMHERQGAFTRVEGDTFYRTVQASQLPLSISENIEKDGQFFVVEIKNYYKKQISATLIPEGKQQNLRISQLFLNKEPLGGPYGRELNEIIPKEGMLSIKLAKSNMAEGSSVGGFRLEVK